MTIHPGRTLHARSRRRHDLEMLGLAIAILLVLTVLAAIDTISPGLL